MCERTDRQIQFSDFVYLIIIYIPKILFINFNSFQLYELRTEKIIVSAIVIIKNNIERKNLFQYPEKIEDRQNTFR